jgi:hypothetical protein
MKILKPLPHAVIDYAWAGAMIAAPWIFGFRKNKAATINSISSGAAILGLSLMTRYPLGAVKLVSFPVHGAIETVAGALTATAPWLMGFERDEKAKWVHLVSGLSTFAVVAMTDYNAAGRGGQRYMPGERGAGMAEQLRLRKRKWTSARQHTSPWRTSQGRRQKSGPSIYLRRKIKMAEKDRNEQSVKNQSSKHPGGTTQGEPGRTPGKAEGDRETVEESLRDQEKKQGA